MQELKHLEEINLSNNHIEEISNLVHIESLEVIDLSNNLISRIKVNFPSKITSINLSQNKIGILNDLKNLESLSSLSDLDLSQNRISALKHYRLMTIFFLRALNQLDGIIILDERHLADQRFKGLKRNSDTKRTPILRSRRNIQSDTFISSSSNSILNLNQSSNLIFTKMG